MVVVAQNNATDAEMVEDNLLNHQSSVVIPQKLNKANASAFSAFAEQSSGATRRSL